MTKQELAERVEDLENLTATLLDDVAALADRLDAIEDGDDWEDEPEEGETD